MRNLYADQEATVRTGHETTDWFQIGKGVCQGYILLPCLFIFYAEPPLRVMEIKTKINKCALIKLIRFCTAKEKNKLD